MDQNTRIVKVWESGELREIIWAELKKGMEFQIFEADGTFVSSGQAVSDAYRQDGIWMIDANLTAAG